MRTRARIIGTGSYLPPKVVKNDDLKQWMDTSDEWIHTRSGIRERRYTEAGVYTSDLALEASRTAIENAGLTPQDIDCIILATLSPDIFFPGTAVFLQDKLGIAEGGCACYDIRQQCSGFVYASEMAKCFIEAGAYRTVLVVGCENHSSGLDFSTRGRAVTVLFGDGAGATIFQAVETEREDEGLFFSEVHADGRGALHGIHMGVYDISHQPLIDYDALAFDQNEYLWPKMASPRALFANGVIRMAEVTQHALQKNGLAIGDVNWLLAHQANIHIIMETANRLGLPREKALVNIHKYGNTTAATIPLLLDEYIRNGSIRRGDLLVFVAFGSGFTWGTSLVRY